MASKAERAQSFGSIADDYDRLRPSPAPDAIDWLVPPRCAVAVDVAAGTGLFTRTLIGRAAKVIAVEPDPAMRAVLVQRSPDVEALAGTGESIPLPSASVDAVFVSSAWHWLDPESATREIARVLRDGGRFGVLWTSRDREVEWVTDLDHAPGVPPLDAHDEDRHRRRRDVGMPDGDVFTNVERSSFSYTREMSLADVVDMVATYSGVITASVADRAAVLASAREKLTARFPGAAVIPMPIRSWCWRADRVAR